MPTIGATDEAFSAFAKNVLRWLLLGLSAILALFFPNGVLIPILLTLFPVFAILFPSCSLEYIRVRLKNFPIFHVLVNFAKILATNSLRRHSLKLMAIFN